MRSHPYSQQNSATSGMINNAKWVRGMNELNSMSNKKSNLNEWKQ